MSIIDTTIHPLHNCKRQRKKKTRQYSQFVSAMTARTLFSRPGQLKPHLFNITSGLLGWGTSTLRRGRPLPWHSQIITCFNKHEKRLLRVSGLYMNNESDDCGIVFPIILEVRMITLLFSAATSSPLYTFQFYGLWIRRFAVDNLASESAPSAVSWWINLAD